MDSIYERVGGDEGVRRLVDHFYDHMDQDPDVVPLRQMHPEDLTESRDKLYEFLSGWMGGPPLYVKKRGHPMLRRRHAPFPVDGDSAMQWMTCMERALKEVVEEETLRLSLFERFLKVAAHMRNQ